MPEELRLTGYREPPGLFMRRVPPPERYPALRAHRIELSSRGDRVTGRLWLPRREGEAPLVLLQHGAGGSCESDYLEATAGPWVERGVAVAMIDLPLHGSRADQKLAARVTAGFSRRATLDPDPLVIEFARQSVFDLERTLDALATHEAIDEERVAFAGFSLGAMIGAAFCALDPRPRAAALALGGAGLAPPGVDPGEYVGRFAPRPLLLVNAEGDGTIPREAALALRRAAGEPVEQRWFDASHETLPGAALKAMWSFLAKALEVPAPS